MTSSVRANTQLQGENSSQALALARIYEIIEKTLPTNGHGEITAAVLRETLKALAADIMREVDDLVRAAISTSRAT